MEDGNQLLQALDVGIHAMDWQELDSAMDVDECGVYDHDWLRPSALLDDHFQEQFGHGFDMEAPALASDSTIADVHEHFNAQAPAKSSTRFAIINGERVDDERVNNELKARLPPRPETVKPSSDRKPYFFYVLGQSGQLSLSMSPEDVRNKDRFRAHNEYYMKVYQDQHHTGLTQQVQDLNVHSFDVSTFLQEDIPSTTPKKMKLNPRTKRKTRKTSMTRCQSSPLFTTSISSRELKTPSPSPSTGPPSVSPAMKIKSNDLVNVLDLPPDGENNVTCVVRPTPKRMKKRPASATDFATTTYPFHSPSRMLSFSIGHPN